MADEITTSEVTNFADLGKEMWSYLTGKGAVIDYELRDMVIEVPRQTGPDSPRATWKLNGTLRITTSDREAPRRGIVTEPRFEADLDFVVIPPDGTGTITGRVHGEGATLVVTTAQPQRLVEELRFAGATDVRGIGDAAGFLARRSAAVRIDGPNGTVVRIGAEAGSPLGRLFTGSSDVGIGSARAIAPLARGAARDVARGPAGRTSVTVAIVIVLVVVARRVLRSRS